MGRKNNFDAQNNAGGYGSGGYGNGGYTPGGAGGYTPGGAGGYTPGGAGGYTPGGAGGYISGGASGRLCEQCHRPTINNDTGICRMCGHRNPIVVGPKPPMPAGKKLAIILAIVFVLLIGAGIGLFAYQKVRINKDTTAFRYYLNAGKFDQAYELANKKYPFAGEVSERITEFDNSIDEIVNSAYEGYRDGTVEYEVAKTTIDNASAYSKDYSEQLKEIRNTKKNRDLIEEAQALNGTEEAFNKLCDVLATPDYSDSVETAVKILKNTEWSGDFALDGNKMLQGYKAQREKYLSNPNDDTVEALYSVYKDLYESYLAGEINKITAVARGYSLDNDTIETCAKEGYSLYTNYANELLDDPNDISEELRQARYDLMSCWLSRVEYLYRKGFLNSTDKRSSIYALFDGILSVYPYFEIEPSIQSEIDGYIDTMKDYYMSLFLDNINAISGYDNRYEFFVGCKAKLEVRSDLADLLQKTFDSRDKSKD